MFGRLATFEGGNVEQAQEVTAAVRDRLRSIVEGLEGWEGVLQLVDRESGTMMTLQLFDTEENMRAAESTFEDMPNQVPEVRQIAGHRASVKYLEIPFGVLGGQEV